MRSRLSRIFTLALMLIMLVMSMNLTASASSYNYNASSSNVFTLVNMSGNPISEIYLRPSYNTALGQCRITNWIYNGNSATIRFTNAEMRLSVDWSMRICYTKGGRHYYSEWDNIYPSELVSAGTILLTSNEYGGMTLDYDGINPEQSGTFTLLNMTGDPITEIYFYPINNSNWGKLRNTNWVRNGAEVNVRFTANELALNTTWCMRLGFSGGRYSFVYWEDVPINAFVDSGFVTIYIDGGTYMYEIY